MSQFASKVLAGFFLVKIFAIRFIVVLLCAVGFLSCTSRVQEGMDPSEIALKLSGDSCAQGKCPCMTPQGSVEHGSKIKMFNQSEVNCDGDCANFVEDKTCENGKWVGATSGEAFFSCRAKACQDCLFNDIRLKHKDKIKLYSSAQPVCGQTCNELMEERVCMNGTLTGSSSFKELECLPKDCSCPLPDASGKVGYGNPIELFSSQRASCGATCQKITRNCVSINGVPTLQGDANYKFQTCDPVAVCSCQLPNNLGTLADGGTRRLSKVNTVNCGESCDSKEYKDVKCVKGVLQDFSNVPITNFGEFIHQCIQPACVSCKLPSGGTLDKTLSTRLHLFSLAPCGNKCATSYKTFYCTAQGVLQANGVVVTNLADVAGYKYETCQDSTGCNCKLPRSEKMINHGVKINLNPKATVSCGQTCGSGYDFLCDNGILHYPTVESWTPETWQAYYECAEPTCSICTLPWGEKLLGPSTIWGFSSQSVGCGATCDAVAAQFSCENNKLYQTVGGVKTETSQYSTTYKHKSCERTCQKCMTPWGLEIPSGTKVPAYKVLADTDPTKCGQPCPMEFLSCENGMLKGNQTYTRPSCENKCTTDGGGAPGWSCKVPWSYQRVSPGVQIPAFSKSVVSCSDSCAKYRVTLQCDLKTGEWKGGSADHLYPACYENCP